MIGLWSEKYESSIWRICSKDPKDKIRSSVWPLSWVAPKTGWERLNESTICKNWETKGLSGQHTWILKSPSTKSQSTLGTIEAKKFRKFLQTELTILGRSVNKSTEDRVNQIHPAQLYLKTWKCLHTGNNRQLKCFLKILATPPPPPPQSLVNKKSYS